MYYDTQRKLAFVLPPRTGTTTFGALLLEWGVARAVSLLPRLDPVALQQFIAQSDIALLGDMHPKPADMQIADFDQYTVYGFFRDPLDRFLSLIRHIRKRRIMLGAFYSDSGVSPKQFEQMNYDEMLDAFPKYQPIVPKFFDPQVAWLANAEILDFNNYTAEVLRVARMFGVTQVNISINNWSDKTDEIPSQRVIDFVRSYYADDYRLGQERGLLV